VSINGLKLAHYVYAHGVRLPAELVEHALRQLDDFETAEVSLNWWLDVTAREQHGRSRRVT
jgi:hypothetical protein